MDNGARQIKTKQAHRLAQLIDHECKSRIPKSLETFHHENHTGIG